MFQTINQINGWVAGGCWDDCHSQWIIPENSLPLAPARHWLSINVATKFRYFWKWGMPKPMEFNTHIMMVEFWMNWGTPTLGNLRLGIPLTRIGCGMNFDVQKLDRHKTLGQVKK